MTGYAWAASEAERSLRFRHGVDELRQLGRVEHPRAAGPRGTRAVDHSWAELGDLEDAGSEPDRDRAWTNRDLPTSDGFDWVRRYRQRCRQRASDCLGGPERAEALHELVRLPGGYSVETPTSGGPAPSGALASAGAAHIAGVVHGVGTIANRQRYYDARKVFIH